MAVVAPTEPARPSSHSDIRTSRSTWTVVALLTILSIFLGVWNLDGRSVWVDELSTVTVATAPGERFFRDLTLNGANMSLYIIVMRGWLVFGTSEWWLRLPSVIFAATSVPLFFQVARRFVTIRAATIGSGLLAVSPPIAWHAKDARSYTLAMVLVLGSWLAALRYEEDAVPGRRRWYVALAVLSVYAHLIATLAVAAQVIWLLRSSRRRDPHIALQVGLFSIPQFAVSFHPAAKEPTWIPELSLQQLTDASQFITGTNSTPTSLAVIALWALGAGLALRRGRAAVPVLWLLLPIVSIVVVSVAIPLLIPRYLLMCVPAGVLLTTFVVDALPRVGVAMVVGLLLITLPETHSQLTQERTDWEQVAQVVFDNARPGELIFFWDTRRQLEYYWEHAGRPPVPDSVNPPAEWGPPRRTYPRMDPDAARTAIAEARGVWVVQRHSPTQSPPMDLPDLLGEEYGRQGWIVVDERWSDESARVVHHVRD